MSIPPKNDSNGERLRRAGRPGRVDTIVGSGGCIGSSAFLYSGGLPIKQPDRFVEEGSDSPRVYGCAQRYENNPDR